MQEVASKFKNATCGRGLNFGRGSQGMNQPKIIQFAYSCLCCNSSDKSLSLRSRL